MLRSKYWMMLVLAAVVVAGGSCTNDALDDGSAADVVLEVVSLDNPPVTGEASASGLCSLDTSQACTTTADCAGAIPPTGVCEAPCARLDVTDWSASLRNAAKNALAGAEDQPFNDIVVQSVTITYSWLDGSITTPTRLIGLGSIAIPVAGTASVSFSPIAFDDLSTALEGKTGNLTLMFTAKTVEGTTITGTVGRQLFVEACVL